MLMVSAMRARLLAALLAAPILCGPAISGCAQIQRVDPRPPATPAAGPITISATGAYTQAASGMVFPVSVGGFERTAINRYQSDGSDESAAYALHRAEGGFILATVYVYPSLEVRSTGARNDSSALTRGCRFQFLQAHNEVVIATPNAELVARGETTVAQGAAQYVGPHAAYLYAPPWARTEGGEAVTLASELHLFCYVGGGWTVKYRFSYPPDYDAKAEIEVFMHDLALTIGRQRRDDSLIADGEALILPTSG